MTKKKSLYIIFPVFLFIIAFVLRVLNIQDSKLWIDELYCFDIANKSGVFDVLKTTLTTDLHAPLFFVILHFWIKIFSTADTALLMLTVLFSGACIPTGYFLAEKLFSRKTAIIFSVLMTFSAIEIFYAQELKFYALLPLLSIISFYFFSKITEKFSRKDWIALALTNILIIYTFNIGIIFVALQFIIGLIFILYKNKSVLKNYLLSFISAFIIYIPYFLFQIKIYLTSSNGICNLFDMFHFDCSFIWTIFQDFFTPVLKNLGNNPPNYNIFYQVKNIGLVKFFALIIFFLCVNFYGLYKGIKSKNNKNLLLISWVTLSVAVLMLMAYLHIIPLVIRYVIILHPLVLLSVSYGLGFIKNKKHLVTLLFCIVIFSLIYFFTAKSFPLKKESSYHYDSAKILKIENIKINNNDYVLMPYMGKFLYKYLPEGNHIDYRLEEVLMNPDYPLIKETFGLNDSQINVRNKRNLHLQEYVKSENPPKEFENYFVEKYLSKMKKGEKLIFIENYQAYIMPDNLLPVWINLLNIDRKDLSEKGKVIRYCILYTKILNNMISIFSKNLTLIKIYNAENMDTKIYIFQKI